MSTATHTHEVIDAEPVTDMTDATREFVLVACDGVEVSATVESDRVERVSVVTCDNCGTRIEL